jgi:DNA-directed RNA polymerase subunit RPC12/RpoP
MDGRIWCPNCRKLNFVKILKRMTTEEGEEIFIFKTKTIKTKYKCTTCKHKWTDIEKF